MKKRLTAVLLVFALFLTMAGCASADAVQKLEAVEERAEAKLEAVEERAEAKLEALEERVEEKVEAVEELAEEKPDAVKDKPEDDARKKVSPPPAPAVQETQPAAAESSRMLTEEQALQIALDHLGFTADQITRLRTEYEIDDRIPQFDIEFHQGDWEYEFEIHGESGKIISYDKDHKYD